MIDVPPAITWTSMHCWLFGPWTPETLFTSLRDHLRPTITVEEFATDLAAAAEQDPEDYHAYGLDLADIEGLAEAFARWAQELRDSNP